MKTKPSNGRRPSRIFQGIPPHGRGQRIGLYGGSFNPSHAGHRNIAVAALNRLRLEAIWWLVTPGNPLKYNGDLVCADERMRDAALLASHPRMHVTGLEAMLGIRYTADLADRLRRRVPDVRFVWIMGSDNLASFHKWDRWRDIAAGLPMLIINRPGSLTAPLSSPAARALSAFRVDIAAAPALAVRQPPAWSYFVCPRTDVSSTAIRRRNRKVS